MAEEEKKARGLKRLAYGTKPMDQELPLFLILGGCEGGRGFGR